ncbi:hypothetical protein BGZ83_011135 [Gryganskiella cystojenkinii]|nr:hypothetical protein BGZ83_011135 [Gryganskiella cystojenkinii]
MLSALSQSTLSNNNNNNNDNNSSSGSRAQSPSKKSLAPTVKTEPDHDVHPLEMETQPQAQQPPSFNDLSSSSNGIPPSSSSSRTSNMNEFDGHIDYAESPIHPFSMPPQHQQQPQFPSAQQQRQHHQQPQQQEPPGSPREDQQEAFNINNSNNPSYPSTQPQQHQQLLKLKTEHGVVPVVTTTTTTTTPSLSATVNTPDIIMTHDEDDSLQDGSSSETEKSNYPHQNQEGNNNDDDDNEEDEPITGGPDKLTQLTQRNCHLMVDTSAASSLVNTPSSPSTAQMETPTTATSSSSSRRPSLRTMPATIPRSALQEETIALFKQFRNLIPCAKCFCRNTIQRDGMSDGNLRFKCRPPVSMSLICNKSYSESKIRNMIAGVVYGHSLPDSGTPSSGENSLGLAPPSTTKSRRGSKVKANIVNAAHSPKVGTEKTPEISGSSVGVKADRPQQDDEDMDRRSPAGQLMQEEEDELDDSNPLAIDPGMLEGFTLPQPSPVRRPSQGRVSRRPSVQQLRRKSLAAEDAMMSSSMDYESNNNNYSSQLPPMNPSAAGNHLQVPGTPPLDGEDTRLHRQQRPGYGTQARSVTPTGLHHPQQGPPPSSSGRQKLHHSHSHPNIGQQRHQQYLEQQEYQREQRDHRGSNGYPSQALQQQQQQQQRQQLQRQVSRRESGQQLGAPTDRRSSSTYASSLQQQSSSSSSMSMSSPIPSSQKVLLVSGNEAHSPALSSSPRSSPGREIAHHHQSQLHGSMGTPPFRSLAGAGRFEEGPGYFQRRMSQPHTGYGGYMSTSSSSGLPPMPSPLSHPYDRRASEAEEYPQMHREKYERLNASTLLAPGSGSSSRPNQKLRAIQPAPPSLPHHGQSNFSQGRHQSFRGDTSPQHPLDPLDPYDEPSRQPMTPPTRYSQASHLQQQQGGGSGASSQVSSPWISHGGHPALAQSEPMRYSHSLPQGGGSSRPGVRHQGSSSSLYYQSSSNRIDDRDQYDSEQGDSNREMSPEYQEMDSDGRPVIRTSNGAKRKSIGHALSRASSHQNLYMTRSEHQQQYNSSNSQRSYRPIAPMESSSNLDRAMPGKSAIKLTCFPNTSHSPSMTHELPPIPSSQHALDSSEAMSMRLEQTSKLVIEITQPSFMQSYGSNTANNHKMVHKAASQPNLKRTPLHQATGSSSPVFTTRLSASPYDSMDIEGGAASKKRRSDDSDASPSRRNSDESNKGTSTMAEAAVAALAAAANAATSDVSTLTLPASSSLSASSSGIQIFGVDYLNKKDIGLGLSTTPSSMPSPAIEALKVAQASSYVKVEDQKELGVDYSLFTRVETAGWRILIPPNVIASFRSEDFGLMLRPKGLNVENNESQQQQQDKEVTVVPKQEPEGDDQEELVDELDDDQEIHEEITFGGRGIGGHHGLGLKTGHIHGATSSTTTMGCSSSMNSLSSLAATTANDYEDDDDDEDCKEEKIEEDEDLESYRPEGLRRDDDEDVNAAGVSRIALGDHEDQLQPQKQQQHKVQQPMYQPFQPQEDVEMEMEQDELVDDD